MEKILTGYCGVDCSVCPDYVDEKCSGCRQTEWIEGDTCLPVECCRKQEIFICGECTSFPCSDMMDFYEESKSHREAYERMMSIKK